MPNPSGKAYLAKSRGLGQQQPKVGLQSEVSPDFVEDVSHHTFKQTYTLKPKDKAKTWNEREAQT